MSKRDVAVRGLIFDEAPNLYDRYRPGYPAELVATLLDVADLGRGSRVVEIGPGTGKLTELLLPYDISVTAIEPGRRMATFLARKLGEDPGLEIIRTRFEDAHLPAAAFDAVAAATAFHWIDPELRFERSSRALRPHGRLVLVTNDRVVGPAMSATTETSRRSTSGLRPRSDRHSAAGRRRDRCLRGRAGHERGFRGGRLAAVRVGSIPLDRLPHRTAAHVLEPPGAAV
jgi:SAM-dependent methyltransferase